LVGRGREWHGSHGRDSLGVVRPGMFWIVKSCFGTAVVAFQVRVSQVVSMLGLLWHGKDVNIERQLWFGSGLVWLGS